jgi:hypothetical protein
VHNGVQRARRIQRISLDLLGQEVVQKNLPSPDMTLYGVEKNLSTTLLKSSL